ncbi:hypothetical protein RFI_38656 [Reticulomyxa filosa]|uniref:Uncharacterized protein n=1 Tax=Reticulomyxa filosa TaxID=46433 RepID=X6LCJ3_RETFI|nr:hypothetical protein RFI_38656 [Reticulomyxa filosa]|eukprot:ETN98831.1 hypothetical protein RFI_38656 [Reticulomyxa filosa]
MTTNMQANKIYRVNNTIKIASPKFSFSPQDKYSLRQSIFGFNWKDPLRLYKAINLRERVLPDGFYVTSMCFDSKDDNLYILNNTNTIHCIALDTGLFNHEREMVWRYIGQEKEEKNIKYNAIRSKSQTEKEKIQKPY